MKRFLALVLSVLMVACCFVGCQKDDKTDLEYVTGKGTLIVGITDFAPMDYKEDGKDEWIGYDADLARAFAESLGLKAEFVLLTDWDKKTLELDTKSIDCVWNGMTLTDGVKAAMETSNPYCNNAQVVVVKKEIADQYKTVDSIKTLKFAVEDGSAGDEALEALGLKDYTKVPDQAKALMEVASGTSQACVIDSLMAGAMIGEGTSYPDLVYTVELTSEVYGVGFRKGSELAVKLNEFFKTYYASGDMMKLAEKYGTQEAVIEQK